MYDVELGLADWKPTKDELRILSAEMTVLAHAAKPFEKLVVDKDLATEIFEANPYKVEQIPNIASKSAGNFLNFPPMGFKFVPRWEGYTLPDWGTH